MSEKTCQTIRIVINRFYKIDSMTQILKLIMVIEDEQKLINESIFHKLNSLDIKQRKFDSIQTTDTSKESKSSKSDSESVSKTYIVGDDSDLQRKVKEIKHLKSSFLEPNYSVNNSKQKISFSNNFLQAKITSKNKSQNLNIFSDEDTIPNLSSNMLSQDEIFNDLIGNNYKDLKVKSNIEFNNKSLIVKNNKNIESKEKLNTTKFYKVKQKMLNLFSFLIPKKK